MTEKEYAIVAKLTKDTLNTMKVALRPAKGIIRRRGQILIRKRSQELKVILSELKPWSLVEKEQDAKEAKKASKTKPAKGLRTKAETEANANGKV